MNITKQQIEELRVEAGAAGDEATDDRGAGMRLQVTSRRPCELERGQARRVSENPRGVLVGYHVCCPRCGYVTVALHGVNGLTITESDDRTEVTLSEPLRCIFCKVRIVVTAGELQLIEDEHVRDVRYR